MRQYAPIHDWQTPGWPEWLIVARGAAGRAGTFCGCLGIAEVNKVQEIVWQGMVAPGERGLLGREQRAIPRRINLYHVPWIRHLLSSRWPQFLLRVLALAGFVFLSLIHI